MKYLDIKSVLKGLFSSKSVKHLDGSFLYPKYGFGQIFTSLLDKLDSESIILNSKVLKEIPKQFSEYESIICEPFFVNQFKPMKFLKKGIKIFIKKTFLLINKKKRNVNFHFDLMHGENNLTKAIKELNNTLKVLSTFDEGPDLVLYYKLLLYLKGEKEYSYHFNTFDKLSESQTEFAEKQFNLFNEWWKNWESI